MSLAAACAQGLAAITRARSLFSGEALPTSAPGDAAARLNVAARITSRAGAQMGALSGQGVDGHQGFARPAAATSAAYASTDTTLAGHLDQAAALTRAGASRLEAIHAQARAIATMAPAARTPADQRMILAAIRAKVTEAQQVTRQVKTQAAGIAAGIRALDYKQSPAPLAPPPTPTPAPGPDASSIKGALKNLPSGSRPNYLEVKDPDQLKQFTDWATNGMPKTTPDYRGGRGAMYQLPDGTTIGVGTSTKHDQTVDIKYPDGTYTRVHVNEGRGGDIAMPPGAIEEAPPAKVPVEPEPVPVEPIPEGGGGGGGGGGIMVPFPGLEPPIE